jgi:hypothetical protein
MRRVCLNVYKYYRGENIPDEPFFGNALTDKFGIPPEKHDEFSGVFRDSLDAAKLVEVRGERKRVVDVSQGAGVEADTAGTLKRLETSVNVQQRDSCLMMMPFADPIGGYHKTIYEPAIQKAGLRPVRAHDGHVQDRQNCRSDFNRDTSGEGAGRRINRQKSECVL